MRRVAEVLPLQNILLCLSRQCNLAYLDRIGETFDNKVMELKHDVAETMVISEVYLRMYIYLYCFMLCRNWGCTAIAPT